MIVAPVAQVAYLISALSRLLPRQLLQDITFNTYEHDIQNQQYRIRGTCLSTKQSYSGTLHLISYTTDFVPGTYVQSVQSIPDDFPSDLSGKASHYANFAAKSFRTEDVDHKLRVFLKEMEGIPQLTVDTFLDYYLAIFTASIRL